MSEPQPGYKRLYTVIDREKCIRAMARRGVELTAEDFTDETRKRAMILKMQEIGIATILSECCIPLPPDGGLPLNA